MGCKTSGFKITQKNRTRKTFLRVCRDFFRPAILLGSPTNGCAGSADFSQPGVPRPCRALAISLQQPCLFPVSSMVVPRLFFVCKTKNKRRRNEEQTKNRRGRGKGAAKAWRRLDTAGRKQRGYFSGTTKRTKRGQLRTWKRVLHSTSPSTQRYSGRGLSISTSVPRR